MEANPQNFEPVRWVSGTPELYAWNASCLVGLDGFMVRIDQRFIRVVTVFVGAFLGIAFGIVLVNAYYRLWSRKEGVSKPAISPGRM